MEETATATVETPVVEEQAAPKTDQERHAELQGKKKTTKKKACRFNVEETKAELFRLEKAGHQQSQYYGQVLARAKKLKIA